MQLNEANFGDQYFDLTLTIEFPQQTLSNVNQSKLIYQPDLNVT